MDTQKKYATLMEAYNAVYENQEQLDEAGLPYGPVGRGFRKIPAGRQREAMMNRANTLRKKAMAASPEGDGGKGSTRGKMGEINAALMNPRLREEVDLFDVILEHLVAEGYAETNEAAIAIMANMSEEWKQSIVEVLDTPERANEYAKKNVRSMLGAFAKGVVNKDISQVKTIKKRGEGAKMAKRKAERKAAEEES